MRWLDSITNSLGMDLSKPLFGFFALGSQNGCSNTSYHYDLPVKQNNTLSSVPGRVANCGRMPQMK